MGAVVGIYQVRQEEKEKVRATEGSAAA